MTRTDVHSPTNLITEDYEFIACGDHHPTEGFTPDLPTLPSCGIHPVAQCDHCGAHLRYYAVLRHIPTDTLVEVGETCLANRFSLATRQFKALHEAAAAKRAEHQIVNARNAWFAANPDARLAYDWAAERLQSPSTDLWEGVWTFVAKVKRYGDTSDKFVAAVLKCRERDIAYQAAQAARKVASNPPVDVPTGRIQISGQVISLKWKHTQFGESLKAVIVDTRGFKVYGTVPAKLESKVNLQDHITLTAAVTPSPDDPTFGFYSRPTQAVITAAA
jgi:hypothetical protein